MEKFTEILGKIDDAVWGVPLIILIMAGGILLTLRLGGLQVRHLGKALRFMVKNEEGGQGEVTSFGALCTALSATIGTGNIVGVATAVCAGGPGALFWMILAAFFGMATKYSEGLLAVKYRTLDEDGHALGGPFYYIEKGMGPRWKWLAKIFAFFGMCVSCTPIRTERTRSAPPTITLVTLSSIKSLHSWLTGTIRSSRVTTITSWTRSQLWNT